MNINRIAYKFWVKVLHIGMALQNWWYKPVSILIDYHYNKIGDE